MILACLCSLGWVALDLLRKALVEKHGDPVTIAAIAPLGAAVGCTFYVLANGYSLPPPPAEAWGLFAILCFANLAGNYLFVRALFLGEISAVLPVFCLTPVVGSLGAWIIMGESLNIAGFIGVLMVVIGTWFVVRTGGFSSAAGVGSMIGVVLCWGMTPVLDKAIIGSGWSLWTYMLMALWAVALPLILERLIRAPRRMIEVVKDTPFLSIALVPVGAAALGLQLLAVLQIEVGLLEAIKRAGVVLSVVLAARLFGERSAWSRLPFMVMVIAGVFLLALDRSDGEFLFLYIASTLCLVGVVRTILRKFQASLGEER